MVENAELAARHAHRPRNDGSFRRHRRLQAAEQLAAGQRWIESGRVLTSPIGSTLDPRND